MTASTAQIEANTDRKLASDYVSLEQFLEEYSEKEDGYKYEWNAGEIEKTPSMNQEQGLIQDILFRLFIKTKVFEAGGMLVSEIDMWTSDEQLRRPDMAIFLQNQKAKLTQESNEIAPWVAEIISKNDKINQVEAKLDEYFAAGVKVVWHIFPNLKRVYVYTSTIDVKICMGKSVCSGSPALEDFEIAAEDIFKK